MKSYKIKYFSANDFMKDGIKSTLMEDIKRESERIGMENLDNDAIKRAEDWNYLSCQIVGAEVFPYY